MKQYINGKSINNVYLESWILQKLQKLNKNLLLNKILNVLLKQLLSYGFFFYIFEFKSVYECYKIYDSDNFLRYQSNH